jgi:CheY-like chemotaxis protein
MTATPDRPTRPEKPHILVVEDDRVFGEALCQVLSNAGYCPTLASDFRTALEALEARQQPIDLLIADIVMPGGVNGLALSRMARLRRQHLKVIYITGYDIPGAEREALGTILRKPVDDRALIQAVVRALAE